MTAVGETAEGGAGRGLLNVGFVLSAGTWAAAVALAVAGRGGGDAYALAAGSHLLVSLYDGRFGQGRRVIWTLWIAAGFVAGAAAFLAFVLPWGQLSYWLASRLPPALQTPASAAALRTLGLALAAAPPLLLAADVLAMHGGRLRRGAAGRTAGLVAAGAVLAVAIAAVSATPPPSPDGANPLTPVAILPPLRFAADYALLRAPPGKLAGVGLMALVALLPLLAPWTGAGRLAERARAAWAVLCGGLGASWAGLTVLGLQPPTDGVIAASRVLAAVVVGVLTVGPAVAARLGRRRA